MDVHIDIAGSQELDALPAFYDETEYGGGTLPSDRIVVAVSEGRLVGAYRLAREQGLLVLRGMRIRSEHRRQGIGRRLLQALTDVSEPCYCVPYAYLAHFYGQAGFVLLAEAETPGLLRARAAEYRRRGLDVVVMGRRPTWEDGTK